MTLGRRALLRVGAASTVAVAGCLDGGPPATDSGDPTDDRTPTDAGPTDDHTTGSGDEDTVPVLTGHAVSDAAVTPDAERFSDMDAWGLFVARRAVADDYFGDVDQPGSDAVRAFVAETAFKTGDRLVYLQASAPQTCYELALAAAPRVAANGLPLVSTEVARTAAEDEACGDAITPVRLLCRLSFDLDAGTPDVVEAVVDGHRDDPEELLLEVER